MRSFFVQDFSAVFREKVNWQLAISNRMASFRSYRQYIPGQGNFEVKSSCCIYSNIYFSVARCQLLIVYWYCI